MKLKYLLCVCLAAALMLTCLPVLASEAGVPDNNAAGEISTETSESDAVESPTEIPMEPTAEPTADPTADPTQTVEPTEAPSAEMPVEPTADPSAEPTEMPSVEPTEEGGEKAPDQAALEDQSPVIYVSVPETGYVIVNPYRLKNVVGGVETTEQIMGSTMTLTNYSSVPVQVNANVFCTIPEGSSMVYAAAPPTKDEPRKALFVYLEFQNSADGSEPYFWSGQYSNAPNQLLVTGAGNGKNGLLTLGAGGESPTYGMFRLFGEAASSPAEMWTDTDRVHITVVFTFTPIYFEMPMQE